MKRTKLAYILMIIVSVIIGIIFSIWLFHTDLKLDLPSFTVSILSLAVSLLALFIALQTYISIDSVSKITKMEGNILENESYVTSLPILMKEYNFVDQEKTEDKIFANLEERFKKKSKTAIDFALQLQYFIDIIIFFPALFHDRENMDKYKKRMDNILDLIESRRKAFLEISSGNLILIDETVKLIKGVLKYQQLINVHDFQSDSGLLDVRGSMVKNSVTRTVYYNYLGLQYNKKAMAILKNALQLPDKDFFEIDQLITIFSKIRKVHEQDKELMLLFLQESNDMFEKALDSCQEDVMWQGFILYNKARTTFFTEILIPVDEGKQQWENIMDRAIKARSKLNILIAEVLKGEEEETYLQRYFKYQEDLARFVYLNILFAKRKWYPHLNVKLAYKGMNLVELVKEKQPLQSIFSSTSFSKIENYQKELIDRLEN